MIIDDKKVVNKTITIDNPSARKAKAIFGDEIQGKLTLMLSSGEIVKQKYKLHKKPLTLKNKATLEAHLSPDKKVIIEPKSSIKSKYIMSISMILINK